MEGLEELLKDYAELFQVQEGVIMQLSSRRAHKYPTLDPTDTPINKKKPLKLL